MYNICDTPKCENEIKNLKEMINEHHNFCYYRRIRYTEYNFDEKNISLQKREIYSEYYHDGNDMVKKRTGF